jgi:DNA helicase-2/ATP-dependent DNA helicase PcrA
MLAGLISARESTSLPGLYDLVLARSGYRDAVRDGTHEGEERWDNLMELRAVAQEYAAVEPLEALPLFLEQVALVSDADGLSESEAGPALLTLHAAKGLEFPVVFIVGMDEEILPHKRSLDDPEAMQEERRLCYVGITRARDHLYLVHTFRRAAMGQNNMSVPSRFLADIPDDLVEGRSRSNRGRPQPLDSRTQSGPEDGRTSWRSMTVGRIDGSPAQRSPVRQALPRFEVGDTVVHARFGEGVVLASHMTTDDQEIEVAFPGQGTKRLSVNLAPLQKMER